MSYLALLKKLGNAGDGTLQNHQNPKNGGSVGFVGTYSGTLEKNHVVEITPQRPANDEPHYAIASNDWHTLATEYYVHHFSCRQCIAAGQNQTLVRCNAGSQLWQSYQAAHAALNEGSHE